eukprot:2784190-Rhodomonas_salina.2
MDATGGGCDFRHQPRSQDLDPRRQFPKPQARVPDDLLLVPRPNHRRTHRAFPTSRRKLLCLPVARGQQSEKASCLFTRPIFLDRHWLLRPKP